MKRFLLVSASSAVILCALSLRAQAAPSSARSFAAAAIPDATLFLLQKKPAEKKPASTDRPASPKSPRSSQARGGASATKHSADRGEEKAARKPPTPPSLTWPVSSRRIAEGYGERVNPATGTVTLNPGINISVKKGSAVRAAAAGKISLVSWLPGFGTFVIIEHRDGFRTVYAGLSAASIAKGAKVRSGERLGLAAGTSLHFEVWREQTRLDPSPLLRK